jgi:hypothetical protein
MPSPLDLNLLALQRQDGAAKPAFPGLFMATPPRRTARGRSNDLLVIYLSLTGNSPLEEAQYEQVLSRLAQDFYKTPGTVTAAIKKLAENLNLFFLNRNLRSSNSGQQSIALLTAAVLRENRLTLGQCGPTHAFIVQANNSQHLHDIQLSGRGLGLTRSVSIRFSQTDLEPNDLVVLTPQPPPGWTAATLQNIHGQGMETLRRRLISQAGQNVDALVAYAQAGTGKLLMLRTRRPIQMVQTTPGDNAAEKPVPAVSEPALASQVTSPTPLAAADGDKENVSDHETESQPFTAGETGIDNLPKNVGGTDLQDGTETSAVHEEALTTLHGQETILTPSFPDDSTPILAPSAPDPISISSSAEVPEDQNHREQLRIEDDFIFDQSEEEHQEESPVLAPSPLRQSEPQRVSEERQPGRAKVGLKRFSEKTKLQQTNLRLAVTSIVRRFLRDIALIIKRILPDESLFTIPASTMAFTAVAIALVMAVAGARVYFQRGYDIQFTTFFEQAVLAASAAAEETDPLELRTAWDTTLFFLNKAEEYQTTDESVMLRMQAQGALDKLDAVYRLNYQNAFVSGLGGPIHITRMAATSNELFMLNANNGTVLRATLTGKGYELDPNFKCSVYHAFGPIISITPGLKNDRVKASVILMDVHGNVMYCNPGEAAKMTSPALPHTSWVSPTSFTIDNGSLYVLDPGTNAVWFYRGMDITNPPHLFFDTQVPKMSDVVDLAVNRDDLYLLHQDGSMTTCKYNALQVSPTRCEDPTIYTDSRPGRHNGPRILDAQFQQVLYTPPPDPSIYLLDPLTQAVYHFSLRLNFQRQYRPLVNNLASDVATAFTISPNRTIFLAAGNQVYYALLP